ncbi:dTDP-4-dehydrorhamnose reductase [Arthrobacter sp. MYb227]|uniref:sugar nucleotide-binding protein n=1 Tax=Arthrobacter sp. MYb227 TaxID=1848601 RepID=UPI000CFC3B2E|nr:sugar nucleotide-binding protein [Arthrobacter sp. MYb227]PQZ91065.1 dTDP-4-dehydrorhamnose reductase [Arthrobacter sp. MYb227]
MNSLTVQKTSIPGLLLVQLPVFEDARGWFKENWQREKMVAAGLPDFRPVQNNVSFNKMRGTTRGIHAEPWDKYIAVVGGAVFGAWVDLRAGENFGTLYTHELRAGQAIFVPRGVGNGFQTLEPDTGYSYLVTEHWSEQAKNQYTFVNLADQRLAIPWPVDLQQATISEADKNHPDLAAVVPMKKRKTLVLGGNGQLGRALAIAVAGDEDFEFLTREEFDLCNAQDLADLDWAAYETVINAAAFTQVDVAETPEGREKAWEVNVHALSELTQKCSKHGITLVHISSDYVFDGRENSYAEDAPVCPLGVYGQTKAAGDSVVKGLLRHYIFRTSWVIGDGRNFITTMHRLAATGLDPEVVNDQVGRLSFATDIARGILHVLHAEAPFGTYNLTNDGTPVSWATIAKETFKILGYSEVRVKETSTSEYFSEQRFFAPRPANSVLNLAKIKATGFNPPDHLEQLRIYLEPK